MRPDVGGGGEGDEQQEREAVGPGPGAAMAGPIDGEPGEAGDGGKELQPGVVESEEGAEDSANAAGGGERGLGGVVKIAEEVAVVEDGGGGGGGGGEDGAEGEGEFAILDGPEDDGEQHEVKQVRLDAEREKRDAGEDVAVTLERDEEEGESEEHEGGDLAHAFGGAGGEEGEDEGEGEPLAAAVSAEVTPEGDGGDGFEQQGRGQPGGAGGVVREQGKPADDGKSPGRVEQDERLLVVPAEGALDGVDGGGGVGIAVGEEEPAGSPVGHEVVDGERAEEEFDAGTDEVEADEDGRQVLRIVFDGASQRAGRFACREKPTVSGAGRCAGSGVGGHAGSMVRAGGGGGRWHLWGSSGLGWWGRRGRLS